MRKAAVSLALIVAAACSTSFGEPKGPQSYPATATERLAILGFDAQMREIQKQGEEIVAAAKALRSLPPEAKLVWSQQTGSWILNGDVAAVATSK